MYMDDHHYQHNFYTNDGRKSYGFFSFLFDIIMVVITGGFWLLWIFVREMRRR